VARERLASWQQCRPSRHLLAPGASGGLAVSRRHGFQPRQHRAAPAVLTCSVRQRPQLGWREGTPRTQRRRSDRHQAKKPFMVQYLTPAMKPSVRPAPATGATLNSGGPSTRTARRGHGGGAGPAPEDVWAMVWREVTESMSLWLQPGGPGCRHRMNSSGCRTWIFINTPGGDGVPQQHCRAQLRPRFHFLPSSQPLVGPGLATDWTGGAVCRMESGGRPEPSGPGAMGDCAGAGPPRESGAMVTLPR